MSSPEFGVNDHVYPPVTDDDKFYYGLFSEETFPGVLCCLWMLKSTQWEGLQKQLPPHGRGKKLATLACFNVSNV